VTTAGDTFLHLLSHLTPAPAVLCRSLISQSPPSRPLIIIAIDTAGGDLTAFLSIYLSLSV
jgi:hypothetical protein